MKYSLIRTTQCWLTAACTCPWSVTSLHIHVLTTVLYCHTHQFWSNDSFHAWIYIRSHLTWHLNESMKQAYGAALRFCSVTASVNQMWHELCSCHSTLCLYGLWQAVTLVSPCCHTCCKNHYALEMLFRIKNFCWRYLTAGPAGQSCWRVSPQQHGTQQGCLQTDRALTQSLHPSSSALHLSPSAVALIHADVKWVRSRTGKSKGFSISLLC